MQCPDSDPDKNEDKTKHFSNTLIHEGKQMRNIINKK